MTKNKKTKNKNLILRVCVFVFVVYAAITLIEIQIEISSARQKLNDLTESVDVHRMANDDLKRRLESGTDAETIERIARDKFDFAYPDETIFFDISGS